MTGSPPPREEDPYLRQLGEEFDPNESSLLAELHMATSDSVPGVEQIILENQQLNTDKLALAAVVCVCVCMCVCVCVRVCVCVFCSESIYHHVLRNELTREANELLTQLQEAEKWVIITVVPIFQGCL